MNATSTDSASSATAPPKKRSAVSIPFLVVALALGAAGYYFGPTAMTYYFLWEGQGKVPRIPFLPDDLPAKESQVAESQGNRNRGRGEADGAMENGGGNAEGLPSAGGGKRRPAGEFDDPAPTKAEEPKTGS